MTFDDWMRARNPKYCPTDDTVALRELRDCWITAEHHSARAQEREQIIELMRDNLCNFTDGGEGMANPSETVRARLSASHIGKTHTDEQKLKISLAGMGRKLSAAHRESLRLSRVGAVASHETRTRISQSRIGRGPSEELRAKTGRAVKCNNDMTFGSV
jgi:hypothetical protein